MQVTDPPELQSTLDAILGPIPGETPVMTGRLLQFERTLVVQAIGSLWSTLDATSCLISARASNTSNAIGSSGASSFGIAIQDWWVQCELELPHKPSVFATMYSSCVLTVARAALENARLAVWGLFQEGGPIATAESVGKGFEVLLTGIGQACDVEFLRVLGAPVVDPCVQFLLAYQPFSASHAIADTAITWLNEVRAATFEGEPLRTGICFGPTPDSDHVALILNFEKVSPWTRESRNKQRLVLGDGQRRFLCVSNDLKVVGIAILADRIDRLAEQDVINKESIDEEKPEQLWVQVDDQRRIRLFASYDGQFAYVGTFRSGRLCLDNPVGAIEVAMERLLSITSGVSKEAAREFVQSLIERGRSGHGGGVIVGSLPRGDALVETERIEPFPLLNVPGWGFLMDADGAVVLNAGMEVVGVGHFLRHVGNSGTGTGTRHSALSAATESGTCIAFAVSDDGGMSVFADGSLVARLY